VRWARCRQGCKGARARCAKCRRKCGKCRQRIERARARWERARGAVQGMRGVRGATRGMWAEWQGNRVAIGVDQDQLGGGGEELGQGHAVVSPSREKGERGKNFVKEEERQLVRSMLHVS
jgi:hypothetical protein